MQDTHPTPPTHQWLSKLAGRFLVFEGPDGSGKSTQLRRFANACKDAGLTLCEMREPGGTDVGEEIRNILLDHAHKDMSLRCEMMLYMASRAELVEQRAKPALKKGHFVLADRFVASTLAYQGAGGGLPIEEINAAAEVAIGGAWPDLVIVFDVDEATAAKRTGTHGKKNAKHEMTLFSDRMEAKGAEYHRRVRAGYLKQVEQDPDHYLCIDARGGEDEVFDDLMRSLKARIDKWEG